MKNNQLEKNMKKLTGYDNYNDLYASLVEKACEDFELRTLQETIESYETVVLRLEKCYAKNERQSIIDWRKSSVDKTKNEIMEILKNREYINDRLYMKTLELLESIDQEIQIYKDTYEWLKEKQSA